MTPSQKLVYDYVEKYQRLNQRPPTMKEIAINANNRKMSIPWVQSMIWILIRDGWITMDKGEPRSIFLTEKPLETA